MALLTQSYLHEKAQAASGHFTESYIRASATNFLVNVKKAALLTESYDVFLSHASEDAILIRGLRDELIERGYSVYVDWIEDPQLDRKYVTKDTATALRSRMRQCRCLLFATSEAAKQSLWMPWELGYVDAQTSSRVAIAPIVPDSQEHSEFKGQEYLGLYPYLDKTGTTLYIHTSAMKYVNFNNWLAGKDP